MKRKVIEPKLLFIEEKISIGNEERSTKMVVTELMRKNQTILSWPTPRGGFPEGAKKRPIQLGRNTHFAEDGQTVLASTVGYPRVDTLAQKKSEDAIRLISVTPLVRISDDAMQASILLQPVLENGFSLQENNLQKLLEEADLRFGIDQEALQRVRDIINSGCKDSYEFPIACGKAQQPGVDEYLQFAFEIGPIAGTMLGNGSIDFRERRIMIGVKKDTLLAKRIEAVPGTPGINVRGEEIPPEGGKKLDVKIHNDTSYSEETGEIRASKDGILSIVKGEEIRVCSHQVITGDIDFETGNVESKNCITVEGCVQPGFKLQAAGDIKIKREVMSATVAAESNIVIKGGITGKATFIHAAGDVDIYFIEHGKIEAGGNVVVRKQSYYSDITAGTNLRCHPGSRLIGGQIIAGSNISVGNVGSENSQPSFLSAGVDSKRLEFFHSLHKEKKQQEDELIEWMQRYGANAKSRKVRKMEKELEETKIKLLKLNLIPGTLRYSRVGALKDQINHDDHDESIEKKGVNIANIRIDVHGTMYAGTELRIGNRTMTLKQTISNRRIKLDKKLRRLIATPLKGR